MDKILLYKDFLNERDQPVHTGYSLVMEGGAAGHMSHPFEEKDLTFGDFKKIVTSGLQGELNFEEVATEKTDGQNLLATVKDGVTLFSRNKGQLISPVDLQGIIEFFTGHDSPLVEETYIYAATDLDKALPKIKDQSVFNDGKDFVNIELIYSKNPNVIYYERDVLQFHDIQETDGEGNIIGERKIAGELVKALKEVEADVQKTFTIIPPQVLKLAKDINFDKNQSKFIKQIEALRDKYGLTDADEVGRYHEMWWRETIDTNFPDLSQDVKEGLLLRWAYDDKKTLNWRGLEKQVDSKETADLLKKFDKEDVKKKYKENIRPFEDLFLELGSIILKNASNFVAANPEKEMQRLHNQIKDEADKIKKGGSVAQIEKVMKELDRLDRIGGIESIIPTEGIVFVYKGKTMKLTGTFAAINQLMGIIKYGR